MRVGGNGIGKELNGGRGRKMRMHLREKRERGGVSKGEKRGEERGHTVLAR